MDYTVADIHPIFYSGQFDFAGDRQDLVELVYMLNHGLLELKPCVICDKDRYLEICHDIVCNPHVYDLIAGGSVEHMALKYVVGQYITDQSCLTCVYEQAWSGFVPDVMTSDRSVLAECGHTQNSQKILHYITRPTVQYCYQIPYPDDQQTQVVAYRFRANKELAQFTSHLASKRVQSLKAIHEQST